MTVSPMANGAGKLVAEALAAGLPDGVVQLVQVDNCRLLYCRFPVFTFKKAVGWKEKVVGWKEEMFQRFSPGRQQCVPLPSRLRHRLSLRSLGRRCSRGRACWR